MMLLVAAVVLVCFSSAQSQTAQPFNVRVPTDAQNALILFDTAIRNGDAFQAQLALQWMSSRYSEILASPTLTRLNSFGIAQLLGQPWMIDEIEVFRAAKRWLEATRTPIGEQRNAILTKVHLAALTLDQISNDAVSSSVFDCKQTTQALLLKARGNVSDVYLRFPNQLAARDVVTAQLGARIIDAVMSISSACNGRNPLLENVASGASDPNCSVSVIQGKLITFELGTPFLLNTVRLLSSEDRICNFFVEASPDKKSWSRIFAETSTGLTTKRFNEVKTRYLRIGTTAQCYMNDARFPNFIVNSFEAFYV